MSLKCVCGVIPSLLSLSKLTNGHDGRRYNGSTLALSGNG